MVNSRQRVGARRRGRHDIDITGMFTATGSMTLAMALHAARRLPNGRFQIHYCA